jgi:hypothetical protein
MNKSTESRNKALVLEAFLAAAASNAFASST